MSQLKKVEKSLVELSQLKEIEIAHNYFDIRVTRADKAGKADEAKKADKATYADKAKSIDIGDGSSENWVDTSNFMLKSEYDKNKDGKVDKAEYADIADKLKDMSDIMLKSEYDPDKDKKVEKAKDADHAHIADKLSDMSNIMLKSEYDKNIDGKVDCSENSEKWDSSGKFVSPDDPDPALGDDGDFWFQYECS